MTTGSRKQTLTGLLTLWGMTNFRSCHEETRRPQVQILPTPPFTPTHVSRRTLHTGHLVCLQLKFAWISFHFLFLVICHFTHTHSSKSAQNRTSPPPATNNMAETQSPTISHKPPATPTKTTAATQHTTKTQTKTNPKQQTQQTTQPHKKK
jgi:hypothetical protein